MVGQLCSRGEPGHGPQVHQADVVETTCVRRVQVAGDRKGSRERAKATACSRQANMLDEAEAGTQEFRHRIQVIHGRTAAQRN